MMMITMRSDRQFVSNKQSKSFDNFFLCFCSRANGWWHSTRWRDKWNFNQHPKRAEVECSDAQMALKTHCSFSCWNFLPRTTFFSLLSIVSFLLFSFRGWCWLCSRSHNSLRSSFAAPFFESEEKNIKINLTSLLHCTNKNKTNFDFASRVLFSLLVEEKKRKRKSLKRNEQILPSSVLPDSLRCRWGSAELSTLSWRCSKALRRSVKFAEWTKMREWIYDW